MESQPEKTKVPDKQGETKAPKILSFLTPDGNHMVDIMLGEPAVVECVKVQALIFPKRTRKKKAVVDPESNLLVFTAPKEETPIFQIYL